MNRWRSRALRKAVPPGIRPVGALRTNEVGVIAFYVPMLWVETLDEKIALLSADIDKHYGAMGDNPEPLLHSWWPFEEKWHTFLKTWDAWKTAHQTNWSRTGKEAETSFYSKRNQYNQLHTEFTQTEGGKTTSKQDKPTLTGPPGHEQPIGSGLGADWMTIAGIGAVTVLGVALLLRRSK